MEGARQGAEGESSKEGADLLWGRQGNQVSPGVNEEVLLSSGPVLVRLRANLEMCTLDGCAPCFTAIRAKDGWHA